VWRDGTEVLVEEQVHQLQVEKAARQMGFFGQYQQL